MNTIWNALLPASRMLCNLLRLEGHRIGHKHVQTLMKKMGVEVLHRKLNTSQHHAAHTVYPYLPCNVSIDRPNQAWASDITYIPMRRASSIWWQ
jgi:putative transposase